MNWLRRGEAGLHWRDDGDPKGRAVLFLNSLGTDLRLWDGVVARLPRGVRAIRMDTRGHGLSDVPGGAYALDELVADAGALIDHLGLKQLTVAGVSLGGMMAQALAVARPTQVQAVVLSNTAAKMGTKEMWQTRMDAVSTHGLASIADAVMERWFAPEFRGSDALTPWRNMLIRTPDAGYVGCCAALRAADIREDAAKITQPALVVAGSADGASPPDVVKGLADALPNARYEEMEGVGHLPMAEAPDAFSALLNAFLTETADV